MLAVTLLSLLMAGLMMSLRLGLSALSKTDARLMANRRVAGAQRILEQQLEGFIPVIAAFSPTAGGLANDKMPFFQGELQSMRFVSSYSLQEAARGIPRIVEFQVIQGDGGKGVRLIVNELLYTGPVSAGLLCIGRGADPVTGRLGYRYRPIQAGAGSFVLADKLEFCRFSYLDAPPRPAPAEWKLDWNPMGPNPRWPAAIRVEMGPLDADVVRLRPVTVTARIHVNRRPMVDYAENNY